MDVLSTVVHVVKWGNSLAVRLPVSLVKAPHIADGDEIELQPAPTAAGQATALLVGRPARKRDQLREARRYWAPWPADFAFNRDEANAR